MWIKKKCKVKNIMSIHANVKKRSKNHRRILQEDGIFCKLFFING